MGSVGTGRQHPACGVISRLSQKKKVSPARDISILLPRSPAVNTSCQPFTCTVPASAACTGPATVRLTSPATAALSHARQALDLYRTTSYQSGQANALGAVGWFHALLGEHQEALSCCRQALTLLQELGERRGQADTWDSLGYIHRHLGHHTAAITCYQRSLDLYRQLGNRCDEAETLTSLGDTHRAAGDTDAARTASQQALSVLDELDQPEAAQVRAKLHHLAAAPEPDREAGLLPQQG
ncbi:tetratricopeptide repeat protein [Lentzea tibetensis]|uniref:Tetratricopeptide repeat protein n=1 Tax=Lentzea tibetensis TaxID=2591470 RepID=A0A563EW11_9PSEU|nr:tetratricopeptide repeat protein [Lentzea tibetensis]